MNESDATAPTNADGEPPEAPAEINPAAEPPPDEAQAPPPSDPVAAMPAPESTVEAVDLNPAAEPEQIAEPVAPPAAESAAPEPAAEAAHEPVAEAAPAPSEPAVAAVEVNPAAEPEQLAEPVAAAPVPTESTEPVAAAEASADPGAPAASADPGESAASAEAGASAASAAPPRPPKPQRTPEEIARADERRRKAQQAWDDVVAARESGAILSGTVTAAVKGGLLVDVDGIRGFLPASQVRVPLGTPIETLVKTKVPLKVIDIDTVRRRIVVSHRRAAEEERRGRRAELLRTLAVGQMRDGVVVRIAEFGAFVDLGGVDGLIPMRELAFERIDKASDIVKIGEHLAVEVLRIDENGKKISLSRKNALPDPWRDHADVLRPGSTVEGKVVGKDPRLLVELAPGVTGSVRESDADPADYEIGEAIEVMVRRADRATRRITLTTLHGAAAVPPPPTSSNSSGFAPLGVELGRRR